MIADHDSTAATPDENGQDALRRILNDPDAIAQIEALVQQLPEINATVAVVREFVASSSRLAENANGIVTTARRAAAGGGAGVEGIEHLQDALRTGSRLLDEMNDPLRDEQVVRSIGELLEMLPRMVALLQMLETFLSSSSRFAENLNSVVTTFRRAAESSWPDLLDRQGLLDLPGELLGVVESPALRRLLTSRVLSDGALDVMDQLADAVVEAHTVSVERDQRVGRLAAFRALGEPDVQRGLAVTIEIARSLGRRMHDESRRSPGSTSGDAADA